jgi:hypothetical protein
MSLKTLRDKAQHRQGTKDKDSIIYSLNVGSLKKFMELEMT